MLSLLLIFTSLYFFFNDTATTEIYTLSLHDAPSDLLGRDLGQVETPGLQWIITVNNRPLYPYINLDHVVNPWGWGSFGVSIRLDENAAVEFVVRNVDYPPPEATEEIKRIGGRIVGRFWYNPAYGDATPHACRFK